MNNLPKVLTQRHLEQDLNSRPVDRKPKRLTRCTTAPPALYSKKSKLRIKSCFRPHLCIARMPPIVRDGVAWSISVSQSVGSSVTVVNCAKTAEPIEMSFGWVHGSMYYTGGGWFTLTPPGEYE